VLKKPICPWNNQNWQIKEGKLTLPVSWDGKVQRIEVACAEMELVGMPGLLRIKKKRGKWIADVTRTQANFQDSHRGNIVFGSTGVQGTHLDVIQI